MSIEHISLRLTGVGPMLMRNSRLGDPLGRFTLSDADFAELTEIALEIADKHAGGRLVSVLEGGYNLAGLASAVTAHVRALAKV